MNNISFKLSFIIDFIEYLVYSTIYIVLKLGGVTASEASIRAGRTTIRFGSLPSSGDEHLSNTMNHSIPTTQSQDSGPAVLEISKTMSI